MKFEFDNNKSESNKQKQEVYHATLKHKMIKAKDFDANFDEGDVIDHLDLKSAKTRYPVHRISIDFPANIIEEVDIEAARIGVTRTSLIKMWIAEHLSKQHAN